MIFTLRKGVIVIIVIYLSVWKGNFILIDSVVTKILKSVPMLSKKLRLVTFQNNLLKNATLSFQTIEIFEQLLLKCIEDNKNI